MYTKVILKVRRVLDIPYLSLNIADLDYVKDQFDKHPDHVWAFLLFV